MRELQTSFLRWLGFRYHPMTGNALRARQFDPAHLPGRFVEWGRPYGFWMQMPDDSYEFVAQERPVAFIKKAHADAAELEKLDGTIEVPRNWTPQDYHAFIKSVARPLTVETNLQEPA